MLLCWCAAKSAFSCFFEATGGWAKVVFLAFDVEAVTMTADVVPSLLLLLRCKTAENAALSSSSRGVHCFFHAGHIPEKGTSAVLHKCASTTHPVTYRNCTLLAYVYCPRMRQMGNRLVRSLHMALINEGSA
ncbi:hypothetical protein ABL78_0309 [Leptomonas seymouri]|uniref:Secreted protein n=1 Tax=Leptomonas seymouri TaxID=5684 RepID=A0A0N0P904_LEPSE|nr:hypothetical protein ABL78_0309 [Leptomonas seymouri]|eukprot:KPI90549.1 hypothetical protein ABL78_0309 [Leptomonas seymouri]